MRDGAPDVRGTLRAWRQVGRAVGAQAISLRVLEFSQGLSPGLRNPGCDEVLYVLEGDAEVFINGHSHRAESESGIYLRPGETLTINNPNPRPLVLISSQCPEPAEEPETVAARTSPLAQVPPPAGEPIVRLSDRKSVSTSDRWYRVLVDEEVGSRQVTQFVGSIPPGRAPDHFHTYEEVLFILCGAGRMWAGATSTEIGAGSCIYLPKRQVHCLENTGDGDLRLLGVFYPAGSPSVRYEKE
ncbi:MAG: cupin domain-containing protein [Acidobacteria bacterium]|nr:cupin domain-containing protein [Acidobacteriota bacterium]